jgi:hypothetical protein
MNVGSNRFLERFFYTELVNKEQCNQECLSENECAAFMFRQPIIEKNYVTCYLFRCDYRKNRFSELFPKGNWEMVHYDRNNGQPKLFYPLRKLDINH